MAAVAVRIAETATVSLLHRRDQVAAQLSYVEEGMPADCRGGRPAREWSG